MPLVATCTLAAVPQCTLWQVTRLFDENQRRLNDFAAGRGFGWLGLDEALGGE